MAMSISTRIVGDLGVTETLGNHFFADSGAIANFAAIRDNPFEVLHNNRWLQAQGWNPEGDSRFIEALASRLQMAPTPLSSSDLGPTSWGSEAWQRTALSNGGRRMLSSGGARSSQRKRHHTRRIIRTVRDSVVGFGWLSKLLRK
jgi:hypothetical protein